MTSTDAAAGLEVDPATPVAMAPMGASAPPGGSRSLQELAQVRHSLPFSSMPSSEHAR